MRSNGYLWTSGVNLDTAVRFADPDFLLECKISAIWWHFPLIFAFYMLNVRHISTSGLFDLWSRKYTTRVDPHVDNSDQVWSWYDHPLPSYSVFVWWYVVWLCDLDLWPFDLEQLKYTWRVLWLTLPPSVKTLTLFIHELRVITLPTDYHWKCLRGHCACAESRDPRVGGQKQLQFCNPRPRFAYSLCNFGGSTMKIIKVICENNARPRPCVKNRMSFCACAKLHDLLKMP